MTIMNHGNASIFTALRENTNGAKDKFITEIVRIMEKYPWCAGVDIDLERGGGYVNKDLANALFRDIYSTVKSYDSTKLINICLPGMTGVQGSVGDENWCVYADLDPYCDTASIMSYGRAWAGSAPGPVSPRSWLDTLNFTRQLKEKNIPVFFEKENINSMDSKGEVMLTIMAS
ncbi:MAG: hypothetical protein ACK5KR_04210, partial [Breznakia sp.]